MTFELQIGNLERRMTGVEEAVEEAREEQRAGTAQILDALRGTLDKPGGVLARVESISADVDKLKTTVDRHEKSLRKSEVIADVLTAVPPKARVPLLIGCALFLGIVPPGFVASKVGVSEEDIASALVALEYDREAETEQARREKIEAAERVLEAYRDAGEVVGLE